MQCIYVIDKQKMQVICEREMEAGEKNLCLKLFSDCSFSFCTRSSDFFYVWRIITGNHPRKYCSEHINDMKHSHYLMCIDDGKKMKKLITGLEKLNIKQVYEGLRSEDGKVYREDYLRRLEELKKTFLKALRLALEKEEGIVYYFGY